MSNENNHPILDSMAAAWADAEAVRASGIMAKYHAAAAAAPAPAEKKVYAPGEIDSEGFARFTVLWGSDNNPVSTPLADRGRGEKIPARAVQS